MSRLQSAIALLVALFLGGSSWAAKPPRPAPSKPPIDSIERLTLTYLRRSSSVLSAHPLATMQAENAGPDGASLGIEDDNTTGQFTHQAFDLDVYEAETDETLKERFQRLLSEGRRIFLLDGPAELAKTLSRLDPQGTTILLDVANGEDRLRGVDCAPNLFFVMPSDAMRADALSQYLGKKRWQRIFLAVGADSPDQLVADSIRRSAKKFGVKIAMEKRWNYQFEDRRTPESEVPVFSQGEDHDVLVVTDGQRAFADLLSYRTWLPRPIMGSSGLSVMTWHPAHEAWGALQLQSRFRSKFGRAMAEKDYAAWLATRIVAEAGTRARHLDADAIRQEMLSPAFAIAGFKGVPLSFRPWDRQLRQPILLAGERTIVAVAPIEGYLHPVNTLDTLGEDQPESTCGKAH